jgi:hypothetical protein
MGEAREVMDRLTARRSRQKISAPQLSATPTAPLR